LDRLKWETALSNRIRFNDFNLIVINALRFSLEDIHSSSIYQI
jgi:hypothetical protein